MAHAPAHAAPAAAAPETISVAEAVAQTLAALGAGHCFGVVGSGNFEITNALRASGVPFTAARHEGGAATMADAYARMSGRVGLVSVHQGCGLTNAATGIGEAAKSRTPVIVLAAEATAASVGSNFSMDQPGLARAVTAEVHRVHSAGSAIADTVRAFRTARDQRRTVVLNLPLNVQGERVPAAQVRALQATPPPVPMRAGDEAVTALTELLAAAERPVLVAGRGGRGAGQALRALAAESGALLATSAVAHGLFRGDDFDLGISGGFSSPLTAELISGADLIVGFGCALNMWTMRHGRLITAGTRVAQVDLDEAALGAQRPIDLGVLGDSAATAEAVTAQLRARDAARGNAADGGARHGGYRTEANRIRIKAAARWRDTPTPDLSGGGKIDPRELSRVLDEYLPAERIVSIDSGNFMGYPSAYLDVPDEFGFCFTQAFQSIGLGLGTAIGAALAQPGRLPVLGTGDGGFLMGISELETAVRLRLPLVCIVYNDAAYGAEVHHFGGGATPPDMGAVEFPDTDIAAIARGFGATGITVRGVADLAPVREWLASAPTAPLVIDAKIASDGGAWWLAEAFAGH
ncbi:thiamine pyrophosphate-dependent acetolactate synthase large subunit-like protein [Leucobacter exalbidus]|uniref:Thiamine pyrophosphate-dependent acetolactate synthase large subunit-like protein n=1 Tax=Leucobacter exalbidus TaxID=662960 RepID=A0A940PQ43_9MICO|nr:thiamine pyrophosphate-dependent acetolactate synthase large subunit-like protein [Leucobacter exalbidus]